MNGINRQGWRHGAIVSWNADVPYTSVLLVHGLPVLAAALVMGCSLWIPLQWIPVRHCLFLRITGYPCFFCGYTRAFWSMSQGHVMHAWQDCPLAAGVWLAVVFFLAFHAGACVLRLRLRLSPSLRRHFSFRSLVFFGMGVIVLNWCYRLAMGLK
ncbi:MAG: DUF2752 domain-containing protein [Spartobacteria bacterium]|nr:DUF2752 domain-containing protein [Spartobacteria bacterium]